MVAEGLRMWYEYIHVRDNNVNQRDKRQRQQQ